MTVIKKLKRGLDLKIPGKPEKILAGEVYPLFFGVKPVDFPGLVPKLCVKPGDKVRAGSPLFMNKINPSIKFTSPVSGEVKDIVRGDRRRLLEIVVEKKGEDYIDFGRIKREAFSRENIIGHLLNSGLWPAIRQRPYHIVANPADVPKSVFISGFDTSPLAPDYQYIAQNSSSSCFNTGIAALSSLTEGKVNLVLNGKDQGSEVFRNIDGAEIYYFTGPHPAGNVGVHIHHLDPLNKGEKVWFVNFQDVYAIGRLFEEGVYNPERMVALTGSEIRNPEYYRIPSGGSVAPMIRENVKPGDLRFISGNVLTGSKIEPDGYLGYYDSQVTVIPEGNYYEFFGWAVPGFNKYSFNRVFASGFFPKKEYRLDTNFHGSERAFVLTGHYEKVLPMDIYPMQLLKAIITGDIDLMENLGIYEVAEEDLALCEFICPSKIEIQSIVRNGLELMIREMN